MANEESHMHAVSCAVPSSVSLRCLRLTFVFVSLHSIVVASPGDLSVQLIVTRPSGLSSSTVQCRPQRLTSALEFYGQPATLAAPNVDYINDVNTLSFGIGVVC